MHLVRTQLDRILVSLLLASLAACGAADQAEQQSAEEPAAAPPADQMAAASEEPAAEPDRFANMFISEVTHDFNPGLPIGAQFPQISALYEGEEIMTIDPFIRDRGAIFIAARSVDW